MVCIKAQPNLEKTRCRVSQCNLTWSLMSPVLLLTSMLSVLCYSFL